jgi:hypothetical protein
MPAPATPWRILAAINTVMLGATAPRVLVTASAELESTSTRRRPKSSARAPTVSRATARPRLIPLSAQVWLETSPRSDWTLSPTVVTTALNTARTSSVPQAATASVLVSASASVRALGIWAMAALVIEPPHEFID